MGKSTFIDFLKLILIFAGVWAAFILIPISFEKPELQLSVANEEKLGDLIVAQIISLDKSLKIVRNPGLDSAMNIIVNRLTEVAGPTDYNYKIKVVENEQINAFTLPGGNIFIYSGLIDFSEHPEEVAAVLAHELGHVEKRHVVSRLVKELGISLLLTVLTGADNVLTNEIGRTALSTVFDRNQEHEADYFALEMLEKANINPKVMATFFRRLNEKLGGYNKNLEMLMTHPHNNSRIKSALEYETAPDFKSVTLGLDWKKVKLSLNQE
ncbi:MAG: M48 family metallopeptidase [Bacteroidetes bacterium]|nr:M48 family metallopeptidase [Bacteroidota bacterium]